MKKVIIAAIAIATTVVSLSSISFASGSKICDNDPTTTGCTATVYGTWAKMTLSGAYSGDLRAQTSSNQKGYSSRYLYGLSSGLSSAVSLNYWAYLETTYPSCNYAEYNSLSGNLTTLNQDTAPLGWNYLGSDSDYSVVPLYIYSSYPSGNLVADAVKISW